MFCKICGNFMDITNNVLVTTDEPIENLLLLGGSKKDESSDYDVSSDTNTSSKKSQKTNQITEEIIKNILLDSNYTIVLDNFDINDLTKISYFNKLNQNDKTKVINKVFEFVPNSKKIPVKTDLSSSKTSYFDCKYCGYNEIIPDKTFIFSRTKEKSNEDTFNSRFIDYQHDNTLPCTKKYKCINKNCKTHSNPELKKAVFYRLNDSYVVRYVCSICNYFWNSFNDS